MNGAAAPELFVTSLTRPSPGSLSAILRSTSRAATGRAAGVIACALADWPGSGPKGVALFGELGAGKTECVRGMVTALGGEGAEVASPTYALEYEYRFPPRPHTGVSLLSHWDLYRLSAGAAPPELAETLASPSAITAVEWPERCQDVADLLPLRLMIAFSGLSGVDERELRIDVGSAAFGPCSLADALSDALSDALMALRENGV